MRLTRTILSSLISRWTILSRCMQERALKIFLKTTRSDYYVSALPSRMCLYKDPPSQNSVMMQNRFSYRKTQQILMMLGWSSLRRISISFMSRACSSGPILVRLITLAALTSPLSLLCTLYTFPQLPYPSLSRKEQWPWMSSCLHLMKSSFEILMGQNRFFSESMYPESERRIDDAVSQGSMRSFYYKFTKEILDQMLSFLCFPSFAAFLYREIADCDGTYAINEISSPMLTQDQFNCPFGTFKCSIAPLPERQSDFRVFLGVSSSRLCEAVSSVLRKLWSNSVLEGLSYSSSRSVASDEGCCCINCDFAVLLLNGQVLSTSTPRQTHSWLPILNRSVEQYKLLLKIIILKASSPSPFFDIEQKGDRVIELIWII